MKRGRKAAVSVCQTLRELIVQPSPQGFYPWRVSFGDTSFFCYARTKVDACKKVMTYMCEAHPCSVQDILQASK